MEIRNNKITLRKILLSRFNLLEYFLFSSVFGVISIFLFVGITSSLESFFPDPNFRTGVSDLFLFGTLSLSWIIVSVLEFYLLRRTIQSEKHETTKTLVYVILTTFLLFILFSIVIVRTNA